MIIQTTSKEFEYAVELAKSVCANSGDKNIVSADGANKVADFVETLYKRFTNQDESD